MHWSLAHLAFVPAALLFLGAAIFTRSAISRFRSGARTRGWPATTGRITRSGVSVEKTTDGEGTHEVFQADVHYTYTVDGTARRGRWIHINQQAFSSRTGAERLARRYAEGASVRVWYDPADPSRAVLEPGTGRSPFAYLVVAALMALAGLYSAGLMCGTIPAVAAGAPAVCRMVPAWIALPRG